MSEYKVPDGKVCFNTIVYGLNESAKRAKYPMATDIGALTDELTEGIIALAKSKTGEGHDNWLNGIIVQFDLTLPVKVWTEAQRYHFLDFVSSQSTMHRITKFNLDKQYSKYTDQRCIDVTKELVLEYNDNPTPENYLRILYSNPCGFQLTAGMTTNYRQLKTMYQQRKSHRLPEWRSFCSWIETLPYAKVLICGGTDEQ